jgi:hypothetical protein
MEKIKSFDFKKRLFRIKGGTIPVEKFLPENLTMLFLAVMVASACGSLYDIAGIRWYFSLVCASGSGLLICFTVQYLAENTIDSLKRNSLPVSEAAAGLDGYCVETIEAGGWGRVRLFHKDREFEVNAACVEDCGIESGERVIAVHENDGFYFVVKIFEIYNGIDTNF